MIVVTGAAGFIGSNLITGLNRPQGISPVGKGEPPLYPGNPPPGGTDRYHRDIMGGVPGTERGLFQRAVQSMH